MAHSVLWLGGMDKGGCMGGGRVPHWSVVYGKFTTGKGRMDGWGAAGRFGDVCGGAGWGKGIPDLIGQKFLLTSKQPISMIC